MQSILIIGGCVAVAAFVGVVLLAAVALGARRSRNARGHRLGRLLQASHPEWN